MPRPVRLTTKLMDRLVVRNFGQQVASLDDQLLPLILQLLPGESVFLALSVLEGQTTFEELGAAMGVNRGQAWRLFDRWVNRELRLALLASIAFARVGEGACGLTLCPRCGQFMNGSSRWVVSYPGSECHFAEVPSLRTWHRHLVDNQRELLDQTADWYIGAWKDDTTEFWIIERTRLYSSFVDAWAAGHANRQSAVFNLKSMKLVALDIPSSQAA